MSRLFLNSMPSTNTLTDGPLQSPSQEPQPFRHGMPMRMSGWMTIRTSRLSRKQHRFAKLSGELLSFHQSENRLAEDQLDVVGALVEYTEKESRRSFKLSIGRRMFTCILGSYEEMLSWATSLSFASRHCFERYYSLGPLIAEGSFSRVYRAQAVDDPAQQFAVKVIKKRAHDVHALECVQRERHVNCVLRHANVVQAVDMFSTMDKDYLVLELMRGGTLADLLAKKKMLGESYARAIMKQVLTALHHIHSKNIVHRDVRPENIFMSDSKFPMSIALGDFGDANFVSDKRVNMDVLSTMVGIPPYMAIEICQRKNYGPLADVWSAGVMLYEMLCGEVPFRGRTEREMFENIKRGKVQFEHTVWRRVSCEAKALIRQMLQEDAYKRVSALAALQHGWFHGGNGLSRPSSLNTSCPTSPTAVGGVFGERHSPATTSTEMSRRGGGGGGGGGGVASSSSMSNLSRNTSDNTLGDRSESSERAAWAMGGSHLGGAPNKHNSSSVSSFGATQQQQQQQQPLLMVSPSVRAIAELGLQRVASGNPTRIRKLLDVPMMQRQLSMALPYRRRLIITAKAFVAAFRMLALARGTCATKLLMHMHLADADQVNAIVDRRRLAHPAAAAAAAADDPAAPQQSQPQAQQHQQQQPPQA